MASESREKRKTQGRGAVRCEDTVLRGLAMKWTQSMTVSRHVRSVRSVHRRGTYRKSGFVIGRYGNTIPRRGARSTLHSVASLLYPPSTLIPGRGSPTPLPFNLLERSASPRISTRRPPQRRVSLCISSRRAACADCVPHETLYLPAFVSPMSERSSREFAYLLLSLHPRYQRVSRDPSPFFPVL